MQYRTTQYLYLLHVMLLNYYKLMEYSEAYTACLNGINICIDVYKRQHLYHLPVFQHNHAVRHLGDVLVMSDHHQRLAVFAGRHF